MSKTFYRLSEYTESEVDIDRRTAYEGLSKREVEEYYNWHTERKGYEGGTVREWLRTTDKQVAEEALKLERVQPWCSQPCEVGALHKLTFEINVLVLEKIEYIDDDDADGELKEIQYFFAPLEGKNR